jgi:hypothetical protein
MQQVRHNQELTTGSMEDADALWLKPWLYGAMYWRLRYASLHARLDYAVVNKVGLSTGLQLLFILGRYHFGWVLG